MIHERLVISFEMQSTILRGSSETYVDYARQKFFFTVDVLSQTTTEYPT